MYAYNIIILYVLYNMITFKIKLKNDLCIFFRKRQMCRLLLSFQIKFGYINLYVHSYFFEF